MLLFYHMTDGSFVEIGDDGTEILFGTADGRVGLVQIGR